MIRIIAATGCVALVLCMGSCRQIEHSEDVTAEITAAQMEGRDAARKFIINVMNDSTHVGRHYHEATDSCRIRYSREGKTECAAAFDSTFVNTVRAVRPDMAHSLPLHSDAE